MPDHPGRPSNLIALAVLSMPSPSSSAAEARWMAQPPTLMPRHTARTGSMRALVGGFVVERNVRWTERKWP